MFDRLATALRSIWLNCRGRIRIVAPLHIARTAQFQTRSDGFPAAGSIFIGRHARISDGVLIAPYGGSISVGENFYAGPYCVLYGHGGLTIGKNVLIGAHVTIIPANHGISDVTLPIGSQKSVTKGIHIGNDVWIGTGARILYGVHIGTGVVVGAGAVVTRSLEDYSIAMGVPARTTRKRNQIRQ